MFHFRRDQNNLNNFSSGLVNNVLWTHLNPTKLVQDMKKMDFDQFPFSTLESYMKRAGITTAYQEKPCLNVSDPLCPDTAPNKKSQQVTSPYHSFHHGRPTESSVVHFTCHCSELTLLR